MTDKNNYNNIDDDFYFNYPNLKGLPVISNYPLLPKGDIELEKTLYDLAIYKIFSEHKNITSKNTIIHKQYAKNVKTIIIKDNDEWNILRIFNNQKTPF